MSYTQEIYDIENRARKVICDKLDEVGSIKLWDGLNADYPDFSDELYELPSQNYEGCLYYIIKIYKADLGYYAMGYETEDGSYDHFDLSEGVDSFTIAELADLITNK